jgi:hypothetical protein
MFPHFIIRWQSYHSIYCSTDRAVKWKISRNEVTETINTRAGLAQLLLTRMLMVNVVGGLMDGTAPSLVL